MSEIFPKLAIPGITAVVGFFWLLAYKHPKTFKAVAAPFTFLFVMALLLSVPFGFAASAINDEIRAITYSDDFDFLKDRDLREKMGQVLSNKINPYQTYPLYVSGGSGVGLAILGFFALVSRALQKEREEAAKSEADAKKKKGKEEGITDGP